MTHILQVVWPITDDSRTLRELTTEATAGLEQLADQAHAVITGPPVWLVAPAATIPGWTGYAPGDVLIARMPAEPYGSIKDHRRADPTPDPIVVERLISGTPPTRVRPFERTAAMAAMARHAEPAAVASRFGVKVTAVEQAIHRNRTRVGAAA